MKTALICMLQLHKNSGSARTAMENIRYYQSRGFEVHVAAMTMDQDFIREQGAIPHKMLPWLKSTGATRRRWYNWQVQRLRQKMRPTITVGHGDIKMQNVLHLHNCVYLASELIHGKPLSPSAEMAQIHGPLLKEQGFDVLIANSELMKQDCVERFGIPSEKVAVIYPALETQVFFPTPEKKQELRARFGFPDKVIVALVTSGNFKKRGLDLFYKSIEELPIEIRELADFRVVGKDSAGDYKNSFLTFDPGMNDIESYYNAIDIFVLPARIEEFGRVVLEAMGCGLPILTTDKVGASELLTGEAREYVVPSSNVEALSVALRKLITNPDLRSRLGLLSSEIAKNEAESMVYAKFDSALQKVCSTF